MAVYIKRVDDLWGCLEELLEQVSWDECIRRGDTVLIKPNFCTHVLRDGVTTNISLLNALISIVEKRAGRVIVGESHSDGKDFALLREALDLGCDFVNLSEVDGRTVESPFGTFRLPEIIFDSKLINVPVLKTHGLTNLTLGIKNLFGLLQDKEKYRFHHVIDELLLHLLDILTPTLNILDATHSMEGEGPTSGRVIRTDLLLASRDVVALDMAACELIGIDPRRVRHIAMASARSEVEMDMVGDTDVRFKFDVPEVGKTEKLGVFLMKGPGRIILKHPRIYPRAKRIKDMLKKL
jgi:uncharacterized protein (DUF362 family)